MGEERGVVSLCASSVYTEEKWATVLLLLRRCFAGFSRETLCSILRQLLQQVGRAVIVQRKREAEKY